MKIKPLIVLLLVSSVLVGWGLTGRGGDWVLVRGQHADGIFWDTLTYRLRGSAIRGQGVIADSLTYPTTDSTVPSTGIIWFKATCSEFALGSRVLITNAINQYKLAAVIVGRNTSQKTTKGMRLFLEPAAAAQLHFEKEAVNQIRVQLFDSLHLSAGIIPDTTPYSQVTSPDFIKDSVSGYQFRKTGRKLRGIASFYSLNLDGTKTATGEKFRNEKLTAASNNLPLNTWVKVTNQRNSNTVIIRINDRMHPRMAKKGRVVDLSYRAARILDFVENGLTKVTVDELKVLPKEMVSGEVKVSAQLTLPADSLQVAKDTNTGVLDAWEGMATVYPVAYKGRKTFSGEIYRPGLLSAASNLVAIGTRLKITGNDSGRWVEVIVNDRLPAAADKTIVVQVSVQAAKMLGFNPQKRHRVTVLPLFSPNKKK